MAEEPPALAASQPRRAPTLADHLAWRNFQATALPRALSEAKAWRNGYAMLAAGIGALLGLIGDRVGEGTSWQWRLALSLTFGTALVLTSAALWLVLTIEGGSRARTVNLHEIVNEHNSFQMYQADQAARAVQRLGASRWLGAAASTFAFAGLMITLWMPTATSAATPDTTPVRTPTTAASSSATASQAPVQSGPSGPTSSATPQQSP